MTIKNVIKDYIILKHLEVFFLISYFKFMHLLDKRYSSNYVLTIIFIKSSYYTVVIVKINMFIIFLKKVKDFFLVGININISRQL